MQKSQQNFAFKRKSFTLYEFFLSDIIYNAFVRYLEIASFFMWQSIQVQFFYMGGIRWPGVIVLSAFLQNFFLCQDP